MNRQCFVAVFPDLVLKALLVYPGLKSARSSEANTNNLNPQRCELVVEVAVPATLDGSARRSRQGKEPHDRRRSHEITGGPGGPVAVQRVEDGRPQRRLGNTPIE